MGSLQSPVEGGMTAGLNTGNAKAALGDRGNDLYETPPVAVEALLRAENVPDVVWEPACGPGSIVRVLRASGRRVHATDLVDYASPDQDKAGWDFLIERASPPGVKAIVTNPPFKNAGEFVAHALELCPVVMMLLRLAFIESEKRRPILDGGALARVHVFRNRLPMMHRAGQGIVAPDRQTSSAMAFAWFVWDRGHSGPTELRRISWGGDDYDPAKDSARSYDLAIEECRKAGITDPFKTGDAA